MDFNNSNRKWKKGIMALCIALALSACDNKKEESASALLTETVQDSSATGKVEQKAKEDRNEPVQDPEEVLSAKMQVYIECYNSLDESINRSIVRYASWINDLEKGPIGNERVVYGLYSVRQDSVTDCLDKIKKVAAMKPELKAIDGIAVNYIESSAKLVPEINVLKRYYEQEDYKDDNFAKGKEKHQQLIAAYQEFEPASVAFSQSIEEINDERQITALRYMEKESGRTLDYYSLAILIDAKKINQVIESDTFDTAQAFAMVAELLNKVENALPLVTERKNEGGTSYIGYDSLLREADSYAKVAKERIRRIRDNVPYSDFEKRSLGTASEWMVEGSVGKLIDKYNRFVNEFNRL
ncbi:YiiG family protein [Xenorhabdus littoralis]|nr:YiiG family protein [Xenorhabdus sp. Reich]